MEKKKNDVMIDIETLGTRPTSAIVQIGACYFDRETGEIGETFCENIRHDYNNDEFTTDYKTIKWWTQQSFDAIESVFNDESYSIVSAIVRLQKFLKDAEYIWAHATFDIPILMNSFEKTKYEFPISYKNIRDIRTLMDLSKYEIDFKRVGIHHNALDDCKYQVKYCVAAMNKLKTVDK